MIAQPLQRRRQDEARESLLAELRRSAGPTAIALEPPRQQVDVTSADPVRGPRSAPVTLWSFRLPVSVLRSSCSHIHEGPRHLR